MKNLLTLTAIIAFFGLGTAQAQGPRFGTVGVVYSFSADRRPVDGNFVRVTLFSPNGSEFSIVKTTISARGGEQKEQEIADRIPCKVTMQGNQIKSILCKEDLRPVDGALKLIAVVPSHYGSGETYDVKLHVSYYDRINGKVVKKTTDIATGLKRTN